MAVASSSAVMLPTGTSPAITSRSSRRSSVMPSSKQSNSEFSAIECIIISRCQFSSRSRGLHSPSTRPQLSSSSSSFSSSSNSYSNSNSQSISSPNSSLSLEKPSRFDSRRSISSMTISAMRQMVAFSILALLAFPSFCSAAAPYEPPGNQVLFGVWFNPSINYSDTPAAVNQRLGYNVPVFQIAQDIPRPPYNYVTGAGGAAPEALIETSDTDAAVFLTVYPTNGFSAVADTDFQILGQQIADYQTSLNRTVFLRYAPEMQGLWNINYGQRPIEFKTSYINCYNIVKAIAPATIFVWAPNTPQGYPFGQTFAGVDGVATTAADQAVLDTNGNGRLDEGDDPFEPYWPGVQYVDWVGLSLYYKGLDSDVENLVQPSGYCSQVINGLNPESGDDMVNWYTGYCANPEWPDIACMFAESGAAWHENDPGSTTQIALEQAWVKDCVTNATMFEDFPRLKMIMHFEYEKTENSNENTADLRDYRLTNDSSVLQEVQADFASIGTIFSWANSRAQPTSISTPGAAAPITITGADGSTLSTAPAIITDTTRARPTGFPSLFGITSDGFSQRAEILELAAMVVCGVFGALVVMKNL